VGFSAFLFGGIDPGERAPTVGLYRGGFTGRWGRVFEPFCLVAWLWVNPPLQLGAIYPGEKSPTVGLYRGGFTGRWGRVFEPFCLVAQILANPPLQFGAIDPGERAPTVAGVLPLISKFSLFSFSNDRAFIFLYIWDWVMGDGACGKDAAKDAGRMPALL
jgi:hypothetical protein